MTVMIGMLAAVTLAAGAVTENPFRAADYAAFRQELRAFYPDWGQGDRDVVKDSRQPQSYEAIRKELVAWCAVHPGYDALDVRRECYLAMRRHFVPFLFGESPFYFEAGVNGGWGGKRPARLVNDLCNRFYEEQNLVPKAAFDLLNQRQRQNLALSCGPFVDDMHHVPPMRRTAIRSRNCWTRRSIRSAIAISSSACAAFPPASSRCRSAGRTRSSPAIG